MVTEFEVRELRRKRVYVMHIRTRCNAVPGNRCFTSKRRANAYLKEAAPILVGRDKRLRVSPETQAQCAAIAARLKAW